MKKYFLFSLANILLISVISFGQTPDKTNGTGLDLANSGKTSKATIPKEDKTDIIEITGIGNAVFTASNFSDGTAESYNHKLSITIDLFTATNKTGNYKIVFYSPGEKTPYSALFMDGMLKIYYPISFYESIRKNLEQSLASKKKIQIKVVQRTDAYKEGTILF